MELNVTYCIGTLGLSYREAVYLMLVHEAQQHGHPFASMPQLAAFVGRHVTNVEAGTRSLFERGLLVRRPNGAKFGRTHDIIVNPSALAPTYAAAVG